MFPFERREKILKKLQTDGKININSNYKKLKVSKSTLHRDLTELEKEGIVIKVRGGAILPEISRFETHFDIRMKTHVKEKKEIAQKAVEFILDDSSIFLDHSSTAVFVAKEIREHSFRNLLVLTNSLVVPEVLFNKKGIKVMLTGGLVENEFKALSGGWVIDSFKKLNIHQIFISVGAVSFEKGLMTQIPFIYEILPEIIKNARQVNVLVDTSKFFKIGTFQIIPITSSLNFFTDNNCPKEVRKKLENIGVKVF
ncbi:MAG: DeoR/GlpR family DNA-binding transcription regulator [Desulfobacterota bacterium]|nr:DeoR/GlpR family DNA-binding transcription regulator [Thermodesulfobacteriota bacterium]